MKVKKIPLRTCVVTNEKYPKKDLLRIVKTPDNEIMVDLKGKMNGRGAYIKKDLAVLEKEIKIDETGKINGHGAYIKKDLAVLEKARKNKALVNALESEIPEEIYSELGNLMI